MKQIYDQVTAEVTIKKSRFITNLIPISSSSEAEEALALIKKEHYNATHNCFAYVTNSQSQQKMSDDGEPARTAGLPILETLLNHDLDNVLCVVTRYYGGTKLGKGGLIRAYKNATLTAIKKASFYKEETKQLYLAVMPYTIYDSFNHFIKDKAILLDQTFTENVTVLFYLLDLNITDLQTHFFGQLEISEKEIIKAKTPL